MQLETGSDNRLKDVFVAGFFHQTLDAWKIIFLTAAGVQIATCLIFNVFGRTSVQPWNSYWEKSALTKDDESNRSA
jgi:hypothetical protein